MSTGSNNFQYPSAIDQFITWQDDVDNIIASTVNNAYDRIIATQTELGTDPAGNKTDVTSRLKVWMDDDGRMKSYVEDRYDPNSGLPAGVTGNRYIATATANGWTANNIYEYNGASWDETTAVEGMIVWVKDEDVLYTFDGSSWSEYSSGLSSLNQYEILFGDSDGTEAQASTFVYNSGNVGIGTTDPQNIVEIKVSDDTNYLALAGTIAQSNCIMHIENTKNDTSTSRRFAFMDFGAYSNSIYPNIGRSIIGNVTNDDGDGNFIIATSSQSDGLTWERMRVTDDGKIGVNIASPTCEFHVDRLQASETAFCIQNTSSDTGAKATIRIKTDSTKSCYLDFDDSANAGRIEYNHSSNYMMFSTNATEQMIIDSAGAVGIGTTNPQDTLHVFGNIVGKNDDTSNLGSSARRWANLYLASTVDYASNLNFNSSGTKMTLTTSGNLGIGSTQPANKLDVAGAVDITGNATVGGNFQVDGTTTTLNTETTNTDKMTITQDDNEFGLSVEKTTGTTGPGFIVYGAGAHNVGIGTTNPAEKLEIVGDSGAQGAGTHGGDAVLVVRQNADTTTACSIDIVSGTEDEARINFGDKDAMKGRILFDNNSEYMAFNVNSEIMRITSDAVGIGTTDPTSNFTIKTSTTGVDTHLFTILADDDGNLLKINKDSSDNGYLDIYDGTGNVKARFQASGNSYFDGGNVGIATTTPQCKLHTTSTSNGNLAIFQGQDDSSVRMFDSSNKMLFRLYSTNVNVVHQLAAGTGNSNYLCQDGSYIGIGTGNIDHILHIYADETHAGLGTRIKVQNPNTGGSSGIQFIADSTRFNAIQFGDQNDSVIGAVYYYHSDDKMAFYVNNGTRMEIESDGGIFFNNLLGTTGGSDARYNTSTKELFYDTSALKYKENIRENPDTSWIYEVPVVLYDRKDGSRMNEVGIIADHLMEIRPDYCTYNANGEVESYSKSDLVPVLVAELQKKDSKIKELENKIEKIMSHLNI